MSQEFDYAVIGSGLTGLIIASALSQETENVVLIEAQETIGGFNREINFPTGSLNNGLRFIPGTESAQKSISFLEDILGLKILKSIQEQAPVTFENGEIKTFLSFGEKTPTFFEELVYFTSTQHCELNLEPYQWVQLLQQKFKGEILPKSFVTRFQVENNQVQSILINGSKTLKAKNYIFCGQIKQLQTLLPQDAISARARQKISKNDYWTALCLDLCHSSVVTENKAMHVLNGTTQDEIGPCVGQFYAPVIKDGQTLQASQWMSFIEDESSEDSEVVGLALKKIKRQIKRAYPNSFDQLVTERILIVPQISGHGDLKLKGNMTLPEVDNLWIGSPTLNPQKNLVGAILQAHMILSALGSQVPDLGLTSSINAIDEDAALVTN